MDLRRTPGSSAAIAQVVDEIGAVQCPEPECGQWRLKTSPSWDTHVCYSVDLDNLRRELLSDTFSQRSPISVHPSEMMSTMVDLARVGLARQAAVLDRATGWGIDGPGMAAAEAWMRAAAAWVPSLISPSPTNVGEPCRVSQHQQSASGFTVALLQSWVDAVMLLPPRSRSWTDLCPVGVVHTLNSLRVLEEACAIDLPHWWAATDCTCNRTHDWIAPLLGWVEVAGAAQGNPQRTKSPWADR